jgi:hypothetical protein
LRRRLAIALRGRGTMGSTLRSTVLLLRVWRLLIALGRTLGRGTLRIAVGCLFY